LESIAVGYQTNLLIAGELRSGAGQSRPVENPATGKMIAVVDDATTADVGPGLPARGDQGGEHPG
jgi:hypothetical protein